MKVHLAAHSTGNVGLEDLPSETLSDVDSIKQDEIRRKIYKVEQEDFDYGFRIVVKTTDNSKIEYPSLPVQVFKTGETKQSRSF